MANKHFFKNFHSISIDAVADIVNKFLDSDTSLSVESFQYSPPTYGNSQHHLMVLFKHNTLGS